MTGLWKKGAAVKHSWGILIEKESKSTCAARNAAIIKNTGNFNMDAVLFILTLLFIAFAWGFQIGKQFNQRNHGMDQDQQ